MVNANLLLVFGPAEDSFLIVHGRRCTYKNMPEVLGDLLLKRTDLSPFMRIGWIRLHKDGKGWLLKDKITGNIWYDDDFIDPQVQTFLKGTHGGEKSASFSFEADGVGWFSKPVGRGSWSTNTDDSGWSTQPRELERLRARVPDCDEDLRFILYGKSCRIYVFENSFHAELRGAADDYEHPLTKVLQEYAHGDWTLDEGSSLSLYDDRHYLLKFCRPGQTGVEMRWNVPTTMNRSLKELLRISEEQTEKDAVAKDEAKFRALTSGTPGIPGTLASLGMPGISNADLVAYGRTGLRLAARATLLG